MVGTYSHHVIWANHVQMGQDDPTKKVVLLKSKDRINFIHQELKVGVSKNDIPWKRWDDVSELSFSTRRAGRLNVYRKDKMKIRTGKNAGKKIKVFRNVSPHLYQWGGGASPLVGINDIVTYVNEMLGQDFADMQEVYNYVYPIAGALGYAVPKGQGRYWRSNDYVEFMRRELRDNFRKDLMKTLYTVKRDKSLEGTKTLLSIGIPAEWIIDALVATDVRMTNDTIVADMFSRMTPRQIKQTMMSSWTYTEDCARLWPMVKETVDLRGIQTWQMMHDRFVEVSHAIRNKNISIEQIPLAMGIGNTINPTYFFQPARNTDDLRDWSNQMGNCIRGYQGEALAGTRVLVGVYKENELFANLEITRHGELKQILGKYNRHLPIEDQRGIVEALDESVIEYERAWGWDGGNVWLTEDANVV